MTNAIQKIIDNPIVKAALFKQLTKVMKDNNVELITLELDADGKMKIEAYQTPMKVLPQKDFNDIILKTLNIEKHGKD